MAESWDVIVVGAGAAGLLAAARSAERSRRTLLLEKNRKPGVKILMSGGTRCNITHDCDAHGIVAAFGRQGPFLHSALAALSPNDVVELFHAEGVPTKVEPGGKVFPSSNRALDVRDALVRRLLRSAARMALGEPVVDVARSGDGFAVRTPTATHLAAKLLITSGGMSYPGCGTTGDGYHWAKAFGHTIVQPRPALTPLRTNETWVHSLSGVTLADVHASVWKEFDSTNKKAKPLDEYRGGFLFTHTGVSGPGPLNVSGAVAAQSEPTSLTLACDFHPETSCRLLDDVLRMRCRRYGKRRASGLLEEIPHRLAERLILQAGVDADRPLAEISNGERQSIVEAVKQTRIPLAGALGFEKAEVTAGGVALAEIDSRTMQSKLVPNLYFAGEILDLDGRIGGYNFQGAFSTGWLAGSHV